MEFLRRLFGQVERQASRPSSAPAPRTASLTTYGDHFAQVDELGLMGSHVRSPDGGLVLVCGTIVDRAGGTRKGGYAVLDGNRVLVSGRAERPQEGRIADNGMFVFNDWLHSGELCGRFMGFRADGEKVIDQYFDANLIGNGLSEDGRYAICQTASAPGSPDSCIVAAFDLLEGLPLARWQPECGTARAFAFDTEAGCVDLLTNDGDRETHDLATGEMRDRDGWLARRIARGDLHVIGDLLKTQSELKLDFVERIRAGLGAAQSNGEGWHRSRAFRLDGELLERIGQADAAIAAYEQALLFDPQAGVAKRLAKLKKDASGSTKSPAPKQSRFEQQAARLQIGHERLELERGDPKMWRHRPGDPFTSVEIAALAHYQRDGWSGCAAEGGLILTLIKAASFERLDQSYADTFIEAIYYHRFAGLSPTPDAKTMLANVATAEMQRIVRNWTVISATAGHSPAFYPRVGWEHVEGLFPALGAARLTEIARIFAKAPYDLRAGWPDLTLWRGSEVRFVEVKSPSDGMHASQARLISTLLVPLGFDTVLAEVKACK